MSLLQKTFHKRPSGLRPDLTQTQADLRPKFVRFPGGCLTHGAGRLDNLYNWKNTIGLVGQWVTQRTRTLAGPKDARNTCASPRAVPPKTAPHKAGKRFAYTAAPYSLTVIRVRGQR